MSGKIDNEKVIVSKIIDMKGNLDSSIERVYSIMSNNDTSVYDEQLYKMLKELDKTNVIGVISLVLIIEDIKTGSNNIESMGNISLENYKNSDASMLIVIAQCLEEYFRIKDVLDNNINK